MVMASISGTRIDILSKYRDYNIFNCMESILHSYVYMTEIYDSVYLERRARR